MDDGERNAPPGVRPHAAGPTTDVECRVMLLAWPETKGVRHSIAFDETALGDIVLVYEDFPVVAVVRLSFRIHVACCKLRQCDLTNAAGFLVGCRLRAATPRGSKNRVNKLCLFHNDSYLLTTLASLYAAGRAWRRCLWKRNLRFLGSERFL